MDNLEKNTVSYATPRTISEETARYIAFYDRFRAFMQEIRENKYNDTSKNFSLDELGRKCFYERMDMFDGEMHRSADKFKEWLFSQITESIRGNLVLEHKI